MSAARPLLILLALWAAVYLAGLGAREIKGEEGRRILPAVAMLDSGDWLVPRLNGEPYLRKPPLANWAIAASFAATGHRNEFAARLPSAMAMLAAGLALFLAADRWLGRGAALAAAAMGLTIFGMMEKGRMAEIEAIYVAATGIAVLAWVGATARGRSAWFAWAAAAPFLGAAMLAKGPLHLLFFAAVVFAVRRCQARERGASRESSLLAGLGGLFSPAALLGWVIVAAIFAAWAIPYFREIPAADATAEWREQSAGRLFDQFDWAGWALNLPRALSDLLPWVFLAPLLWKRGGAVGRSPVLAGLRDGSVACFVGLLLVPGVLPRYVLPLAPGFALLFAAALADLPARAAGGWRRCVGWIGTPPGDTPALAVRTASVVAATIAALAFALPPLMAKRPGTRSAAAAIDACLPDGITLYAVDVGYQPALFYLRSRVAFLRDEGDVKGMEEAHLLAPEKVAKKLRRNFRDVAVLGRVEPPNAKALAVVRASGPVR